MEINVGGRGGGKLASLEPDAPIKGRGRPVSSHTVEIPSDYKYPTYLKQYVTKKIKMLQNEFHLKLTAEEIARFWQLPGDDQVDRYAHKLIQKYL